MVKNYVICNIQNEQCVRWVGGVLLPVTHFWRTYDARSRLRQNLVSECSAPLEEKKRDKTKQSKMPFMMFFQNVAKIRSSEATASQMPENFGQNGCS